MAPGSACIFVDREGKEHHALVIHKWNTSVNIAHVVTDPAAIQTVNFAPDSYGFALTKETSVPFYEPGMSGFYIKPDR